MTKFELVTQIEVHVGPTNGLWKASKPTLAAILIKLNELAEKAASV